MTGSAGADLGVYIHWPYCARVCPYCDFNVVRERGREAEKADLVEAIVDDLAAHAALTADKRLRSIFFGGGTPSLMAPEAIARIVQQAKRLWRTADDLEISLEANPTDAETSRFSEIAGAGVERLSLGVQSLNDQSLTFLGRNHDARTAERAIQLARNVFERLSIDLIYALPGQTVAAWSRELRRAIATGCEHLSPYQLSIEPGAAFHRAVRRGAFTPAAPEVAADLYEATQDILKANGFDAYEISNHALGAGARSRHNLIYWRGADYIGVGPGAHGRLTIDDVRWAMTAADRVADYIASVRETGFGSARETLSSEDAAIERLVMGLRTTDGVSLCEVRPLRIAPSTIAELNPFVTVHDGRLTATPAGRLVLDRVLTELTSGSKQ